MALGWALVSTGRHADTVLAPALARAEETQLVAVYSREQAQADTFAAVQHFYRQQTGLEPPPR